MRWLLIKDLQILRRSPLLVALLAIYPIAIALLIGFALSRGPDKPRVAFLNEVPANASQLNLGATKIDASKYAAQLFQAVTPVRVHTREEAIAKVKSGDALAALIIPPDIVAKLASGLESADVEVLYNGDALKQSFVRSAIDSKLAAANGALAQKLEQVAATYIDLLLAGGKLQLPGGSIDVLGLRNAKSVIDAVAASLPRSSTERAALAPVQHFAQVAVENLGFSKQVLGTVASPIHVKETLLRGHRTPLDAFAVAIAATVSLMFVCVLLAAGMLALEREENTFARLARGRLVSREGLLAEKAVLAAACSFVLALAMLSGIGLFVHLDWSRFALWVLALAGGALGFAALGVAIGSLAREVRAASLLAFLLTLPLAFLALVPSGSVAGGVYDAIRVISAIFPFKPALQAIDAAINDSQPGLLEALAHLAALTLAFGAAARAGLRRF
ncbi:MAG: ABC transporter permease [Solirubrobacteraceae bacterium]